MTPMAVVLEDRDLDALLWLLSLLSQMDPETMARLRKATATAQPVSELSGERPL